MGRASWAAALVVVAMLVVGCGGSADDVGGVDGVVPTEDVPPPDGFGEPNPNVPVVSDRTFQSGSAKVKVSGGFAFDEDIPINTAGSIAQDGMTYLLYGDSGSAEPNATITIQQDLGEIGILVAMGPQTANASSVACSGQINVADASISGHYTCPGATAYDPASEQMSTVDIEIDFTADS